MTIKHPMNIIIIDISCHVMSVYVIAKRINWSRTHTFDQSLKYMKIYILFFLEIGDFILVICYCFIHEARQNVLFEWEKTHKSLKILS